MTILSSAWETNDESCAFRDVATDPYGEHALTVHVTPDWTRDNHEPCFGYVVYGRVVGAESFGTIATGRAKTRALARKWGAWLARTILAQRTGR